MQILAADDDFVARNVLKANLCQWGYDVIEASSGEETLRILQSENAPRLALIDWLMPDLDGIEICRCVRENNEQVYPYLILITGYDSRQDLIEGLMAGADDYIIKPFEPGELEAKLQVACRILNQQAYLQKALEVQRYHARHDPLTGILNHGAILEQLQKELLRSERLGLHTGVVMIDVDCFKRLNDRFGHLAGDEVLKETSRRIVSAVRGYDLVGRYGGEEFLVILPGCNMSESELVARRIQQTFRQDLFKIDNIPVQVTVSGGVTTCQPGLKANVKNIIMTADQALYRAKQNGRNRVEIALPAVY
ncbi:GGDEF domain-containing response regulator [Syntrophomonas palmitatica]|uniref:GGDEF domain-containing response regulator n=1 Tax=Syntrophomonas palmitatica TaxID=402877 RepID=UPI000B18CF70|nr:diguanylate cyclase [Syntrophomonas palmitatica]